MATEFEGKSKRAVLFANGVVYNYSRLRTWVTSEDYKIGVNGGTRHCLELGYKPNVVIGDLDSIGSTCLAEVNRLRIPILQFPSRKARTDLDLAMIHIREKGLREAIVLGMWGGRLDQSLANLFLLTNYMEHLKVTVVNENETAQFLGPGNTLTIEDREGATASILPLSAQVEGVTLTGMEYPLHNALLQFGTTLGISNVVQHKRATISIQGGLILATISRID